MVAQQKGFTIIEALVSIGIATAVITAPMSIIARHLIENAITKDTIVARFLAQESIEYARYLRDNEFLAPTQMSEKWYGSELEKCNGVGPCVVYDKESENGLVEDGFINYLDNKSVIPLPPSVSVNDFCSEAKKNYGPSLYHLGDSAKKYNSGEYKKYTSLLWVRDANIEPPRILIGACVLWQDDRGNVVSVELQETLYRWIKRKY